MPTEPEGYILRISSRAESSSSLQLPRATRCSQGGTGSQNGPGGASERPKPESRFEGPAASLHFHEPSVAVDRDTAGPPAVRATVTEPPLTEGASPCSVARQSPVVATPSRNGRPTSNSEPHVPAMTMGLLAPATLAITVLLQGVVPGAVLNQGYQGVSGSIRNQAFKAA